MGCNRDWKDCRWGNERPLVALYKGGLKLWPLTAFITLGSSSLTSVRYTAGDAPAELYFSYDRNTWTPMAAGTDYSFGGSRGDIYINGNNPSGLHRSRLNIPEGAGASVRGDITALLRKEGNVKALTAGGEFEGLFADCLGLADASSLIMTPETLSDSCYKTMFLRAAKLTKAPSLPAMTMASECYQGLFQDCKALTAPPALPAMTLAQGCYREMFTASGLTQCPALPATTLADWCYDKMFEFCFELTETCEFPATEAAFGCYYQMFFMGEQGSSWKTTDSKLKKAHKINLTSLAPCCCGFMFQLCSALSDVPEDMLPDVGTLPAGCYNAMFYNTAITATPVIHGNIVEAGAEWFQGPCYQMFRLCKYLTRVTDIRFNTVATTSTAANIPMRYMFRNCSSLRDITFSGNAVASLAYNSADSWLTSIASTGTFRHTPALASVYGLPTGWTRTTI